MDYRYLGRTGLRVSELCLGTMTFGWKIDEAESHRILDAFSTAGGNFIDTADVYAAGGSETILGSWLKENDRDDFVIATKVRGATGKGANDIGLSRKHIMKAVKDSLRRLGTDYIDIYQAHAWDPATPLRETLLALDSLVEEGMVRYIGASNFRGWQLQKAVDMSLEMGLSQFCSLQPQYSLLCRATEFELIPACLDAGIGVIPWSPLKGGILSGKYRKGSDEPPESTRYGEAFREGNRAGWESVNRQSTWELLDTLRATAQSKGKSMAQIALNWLLRKPGVTSPIIGARSIAQLEENLGSTGWELTAEDIAALDAKSAPDVSHPYDTFAEQQQRRGR